MNLSDLYIYPNLLVGDSPYNPAAPIKTWVRPLSSGENPQDDYVYQYYKNDGTLHTAILSKGAAALDNVQQPVAPGVTENTTIIPIPVDPTKLPTGFTVVATPFGLLVQSPAASSGSPSDTVETRILNGVNAILASLGKPQV